MTGPHDALLLVSFGGPEGPEDVLPFLENVTKGRGIPRERLAEVGEHYSLFGGVSPINTQNRSLLAAIRSDFAAHGLELPVYWGNRNWAPYLSDTVRLMGEDGVRRCLAFVTSAYSSYPGCRQYRENLAAARSQGGPNAPEIDKIRVYFDHPGFVEPMIDNVVEAIAQAPDGSRLVFTTHSIPTALAESSGPPGLIPGGAYVAEHREVARLIAQGVARVLGVPTPDWDLVYQSRSGPTTQPWLEPDVVAHIEVLSAERVPGVVLAPIGFVSDHMEVVYDLDTLAAEAARELRLPLVRAATAGTDPRFVAMIRELVLERVSEGSGERMAQPRSLSALGPWPDLCPKGCCSNPRGNQPAVSGEDEVSA